jgi:phosphate transport system substrate-binding protein
MWFPNRFFLFLLSGAFVYSACTNNEKKSESTNTSGEVKITVDESFKKLFSTQVTTFEAIYPNATIHVDYLPESSAFERLLNDSCKVIVMGRDLTINEIDVLKSKNIFPASTKIAEDAIVLIVNPESAINNLTVEEVKQILLGTYKKEHIQAVFDNKRGANARYMQDSLLGGRAFSNNVFAVNSNIEVIDYVARNKNSLGFLSFNWMSDSDDTLTTHILKKIKVVALSKNAAYKTFKPYQAYIQTKEYAFCRNIYMVNRQKGSGLGTGFVIFVAGEKGQLIVLKSGLVPAFPPERIIHINTN